VWLLLTRQVPSLQQWMDENFIWPVWMIGAGILIFILGLLLNAPGMAVPASIVTGLGGIFYYQVMNDDYSSWSYLWTLIPGFIGIGTILMGLLGENTRRNISSGLNLLVISAVLFLVFATFFGELAILGEYGLAILLILLGVYVLVRGFIRSRKRGGNAT
jgi:peptidoglycan/LPS O-acetylase OafA/YrhL